MDANEQLIEYMDSKGITSREFADLLTPKPDVTTVRAWRQGTRQPFKNGWDNQIGEITGGKPSSNDWQTLRLKKNAERAQERYNQSLNQM